MARVTATTPIYCVPLHTWLGQTVDCLLVKITRKQLQHHQARQKHAQQQYSAPCTLSFRLFFHLHPSLSSFFTCLSLQPHLNFASSFSLAHQLLPVVTTCHVIQLPRLVTLAVV